LNTKNDVSTEPGQLQFILVALLHLALGLGAEVLLGAVVPADVLEEPSLNSQNRFYGVVFALYGVVFYLCAQDLRRFESFFKATVWVFFLGGLARLLSWATHGTPAPLILALAASELLIPPLLLIWYAKVKNDP
jgi:Domain of unknown function (DUF4345)